ncbi:MAG TPA: hypothetical protein PKC19_01150 [Roseiflexaceae bacterium]|nr:hypothetical protein [Roseiflexaceae bacterium]
MLPIYYTLFGAMTAFGVGKVGAYANYFLEFDAGLIWLVALAVAQISRPQHATRRVAAGLLPLLVAAALVRYYPIWSEEFLKPYGLIEGRRPARLVIGGYGVLADLARERVILSALGRVQAALATEVRAANAPIVTDIPAIAAQAGVAYRFQAFEHRQLYDTGLWDQRPLLRELANGRIPLIGLGYLGNWLTPEMITLITSRYAQDGSRGDFDLYRPLAIGSLQPLERDLGANLALRSLALAPPAAAAYSPGETLLVALALQANGASVCDATPGCALALTLADTDGFVAAEARLPLLYGVLPPRDWGGATVQQLVPLALPPALAPGRYTLQVALLASTATHGLLPVAQIEIGTAGGRLLGEQGYFVPEPILRAWVELGGYDGVGDPIMPAVPFADGIGQCFVYQCLRLQGGMVQREPLGERIALSEPVASSAAIDPAFADAYRALGGEEGLGSVLGPAFERRGMLVQYTRFARLEQPLSGGDVRRGALGIDYLRLPGGMPYRWPAPF